MSVNCSLLTSPLEMVSHKFALSVNICSLITEALNISFITSLLESLHDSESVCSERCSICTETKAEDNTVLFCMGFYGFKSLLTRHDFTSQRWWNIYASQKFERNRKPFFMGFKDTFKPCLWSEQNSKILHRRMIWKQTQSQNEEVKQCFLKTVLQGWYSEQIKYA